MRRPINWFVFSIAMVFLLANLMLAGCGGGSTAEDGGAAPPPVSGMLRRVSSAAELEASLKSSLQEVVVAAPQSGTPFTAVTADRDFSSTYTAEAGVDEFDHVRYDGSHLYVAPSRFADPGAAAPLRILRTDASTGTATQVSTIAIEADKQVMGIYVADGRLVMLSSEMNYPWRGPFGDSWATIAFWEPTTLEIRVFDVVDPADPVQILAAEIDGAFVETRRVGDRVYLITRHAPSILMLPDSRTRLASATLEELLPQIRSAGGTRALVSASDCYITNEAAPRGYPILTTITSFSMRNPDDFASTCYNDRATGVYASMNALYVSQQDVTGGASATRIHKFSFTGGAPAYAGSVQVPGYLWTGGQRDFRMNEYQGMLRLMVTESTNDPGDWQDHRLFVLRPKPNALALEVVSSLPNDSRPAEIGKPGDGLNGVRFLGNRAFAVTFRRLDPLYVLDLADPRDPRIAGELEVPGFSEFLHPVTQNLLLGIGSTDPGDVKLELFDVSVLERPQSRGMLEIGGEFAYTEAMTDRHAFTYLPGDAADRFAIPYTESTDQGSAGWRVDSSLRQFEILGKQNAASASLQAAGVVTPPVANDSERVAFISRAYIHGDTLFYVRDGRVWSTFWAEPSQVRGPF